MFSIFIPNLKELISVFALIFLIFSFYINGYLITKKQEFNLNFCIGWSLYSFIFIFFGTLFKIKLSYLIYFYSLVNFVLILINFQKIRFGELRYYIFLIPILIVFLNTKTHGYDSFAFLLDKVIYLLKFNEFPETLFRSNYPFTSNLIHYYSNFFVGSLTQNIPALFDFFLILGSLGIFSRIFAKRFSTLTINFFIIFASLIFFNPMIMNVYSFSSYEDFHVAYILLVIFYYNYNNNFDLNKLLNQKIIYIFLLSLLSLMKATGFILAGAILFSNLVIYLIYHKPNIKIIKYFFTMSFLVFLQFFLWQFHLIVNEIELGNSFKGFRIEVFKNIIENYYNQFLVKKLLILSNFIFMFSPFFIFSLTKNEKIKKTFIFISIPVFIWNFFHLIFFIFIQGYGHAIGFHNFFRYLSQFSLIYTFVFLILVISKIQIQHAKKIKSFSFTIILLTVFYSIFLLHLKDFRRDLSAEYKIVNSLINEEKFNKIILKKDDYIKLDRVIIGFYERNYDMLIK